MICDRFAMRTKPDVSEQQSMNSHVLAPDNVNTSPVLTANVMSNCTQIVDTKGFVYLQTMKAEIINGGKIHPIRILLDLGSTKSFCLKNIAKELELPVIAQENTRVYSFGEAFPKLERNEKVKITLRNILNHDQTFN